MTEEQRQKKAEFLANQAKFIKQSGFDTVQIFASKYEDDENGDTSYWVEGRGNWCARFGQVREWLISQECNQMHKKPE